MESDDALSEPPSNREDLIEIADSGDDDSINEISSDIPVGTVVDAQAAVENGAGNHDDVLECDVVDTETGRTQIEVAIPELSIEKRQEHEEVHSEVVESVLAELSPVQAQPMYRIEFTDGREEMLSLDELVKLEDGTTALAQFGQGLVPQESNMTEHTRKRKRTLEVDWGSDVESVASDPMDLDEEDSDDQPRRPQRTSTRSLRSRGSTRPTSRRTSPASDEDDLDDLGPEPPVALARTLRTRKPQQLTLTSMSFKSKAFGQEQDELGHDSRQDSSDEDDGDFLLVTSDLAPKKGRNSKVRQKSKRLSARHAKPRGKLLGPRRKSPDSDIEFEAPRRSVRSTRNKVNMGDDSFMDDDSFYVVDDKSPAVAKVISIREVFQPLPHDSQFASMHMQSCHTCGGSKNRGQLVHCQGCTLSYHKNCLGYRSAREHMVTKVGEDDFVLQCKFCIGLYQKKDSKAPAHSMCQDCKDDGCSCAPFSEKQTARQEEKLREENDGVDPITHVSENLLNNSDAVLFRCSACHRAWHVEHLPRSDDDSDTAISTDVKSERLKDYSIDWKCNDCSSARHKIHRLVAWRPLERTSAEQSRELAYNQVSEDEKEYLIKWESLSYVHCTWKPGAWVHGVAAPAMRTTFGKRDEEQDSLKLDEKEAIPMEFITPEIILNAKMQKSASRFNTRVAEMANISKVSKILVKFQGLGYDDVVWDSPPEDDEDGVYGAFVEAYREYLEGKYFRNESISKIRDRIKAFKAARFVEVDVQPAGLKRGKLMGYQIEGLNWLLENYHANRSVVLADEMGLGKTVQVVSLVTSLVQDSPKCWPFLIVVPNATCPNWRREFKQWAPDLRVVTYHGGKEPQDLAYKYELFPNDSTEMRAHVVIMSYDSAADPKTKVLFKTVNWTGLVVDEGQRLKNDQNLLYVALRAMRIPFRLLLTGTPLQNNKRELFNLIQFIDETQNAERLDEEFAILDKETLPKLHEKIRPYFLRRTKAGVLKFLPPMTQIILPVTMSVLQEKLSKSIMAKNPELIKSMFANSKMNKKERGSLNNILMQLRKCLCHPFVYSEAIEEKHHDSAVLQRNLVEASSKLLLLEQMLPRLKERGHRVLIFSQFLQQLDIIEDFLSGMGYEFRRLDGQIGSLEKQRRIDAFNAPDSELFAFLLSTRAGGVGINLATADTVIILDPDFNPHQDIQALSRAHRIGQKKKVLCFQIVTKDSVEERIMQVGRKKMALDHALIESMDDDELAGDDLESILKHGAQALFDENYEKKAIVYDSAAIDNLLDRTQDEEPETADAGARENQFGYARVWANEKSGFEDSLAPEEMDEPEPINSSVWDRILAEREEEARREAEANREVLGRGNRRRMAVNYRANAADTVALLGEPEAESSASSDDFAGAESAEESDDDDMPSAKDAEEDPETGDQTANSWNAKAWKAAKYGGFDPQNENKNQSSDNPDAAANAGAQQPQVKLSKPGRPPKDQQVQFPALAHRVAVGNNGSGSNPAGVGSDARTDKRQDLARFIRHNYRPKNNPLQALQLQQQEAASEFVDYSCLGTHAEVRLALDRVQHSDLNPKVKTLQRNILLRKLAEFGGRNKP